LQVRVEYFRLVHDIFFYSEHHRRERAPEFRELFAGMNESEEIGEARHMLIEIKQLLK
jgi:hypothetical protein